MRILFVAIMTYPTRGGTHLRNWQNINIMRKFGEVAVFSVYNEDLQTPVHPEIRHWDHFNIDRQSALPDLMERAIRLFRRFGLRYYWAYTKRAAKALDEAIQQFNPSVVVLEELATYPYLHVVQQYNCKIIFDNHNVETHFFRQLHCARSSLLDTLRFRLHLPQIRQAEAGLIRQASQTWICSETDQQLMHRLHGPASSSFVIPNAIDTSAYSGTYPLPQGVAGKAKNVLFLGNFSHPPNREAANFLIEAIYPRLKQKTAGFQLLLVGSNPAESMKKAARRETGILVTGAVPDVRPFLAAANALVVPLFKGSGTRFKILEAFAAGCPVISTAKGAEGLGVKDEGHLLIANDVETMLECIEKLWSHEALGRKLAASAKKLVQAEYSWDAVAKRVEAGLKRLDDRWVH